MDKCNDDCVSLVKLCDRFFLNTKESLNAYNFIVGCGNEYISDLTESEVIIAYLFAHQEYPEAFPLDIDLSIDY